MGRHVQRCHKTAQKFHIIKPAPFSSELNTQNMRCTRWGLLYQVIHNYFKLNSPTKTMAEALGCDFVAGGLHLAGGSLRTRGILAVLIPPPPPLVGPRKLRTDNVMWGGGGGGLLTKYLPAQNSNWRVCLDPKTVSLPKMQVFCRRCQYHLPDQRNNGPCHASQSPKRGGIHFGGQSVDGQRT